MRNKLILNGILREEDFYPPSDDRTLQTCVEELYDGDFAEYSEYIFDLYESENFYEN